MSNDDFSLANMILYSKNYKDKKTVMSDKLKELAQDKSSGITDLSSHHLFKEEQDQRIQDSVVINKRLQEKGDLLLFPYRDWVKLEPHIRVRLEERLEFTSGTNLHMSESEFDFLFNQIFPLATEKYSLLCYSVDKGKNKIMYSRLDGQDPSIDSLSDQALERLKKKINPLVVKQYLVFGKDTKIIWREHGSEFKNKKSATA